MARKKDAFKKKRGEVVYSVDGAYILRGGGVEIVVRIQTCDGWDAEPTFFRSAGDYPSQRELDAAVVRTKKAFAKALIG